MTRISSSSIATAGRVNYSDTYKRSVTLLMMLAYTLYSADRSLIAIIGQPMKMDLILTDTQLGLLVGTAFAARYAFSGLPLAPRGTVQSRDDPVPRDDDLVWTHRPVWRCHEFFAAARVARRRRSRRGRLHAARALADLGLHRAAAAVDRAVDLFLRDFAGIRPECGRRRVRCIASWVAERVRRRWPSGRRDGDHSQAVRRRAAARQCRAATRGAR
jgi:hypothetical protein